MLLPRAATAIPLTLIFLQNLEMCLLQQDISHYVFVAQGKTTIPGVDDGEELRLTDVCFPATLCFRCCFSYFSTLVTSTNRDDARVTYKVL